MSAPIGGQAVLEGVMMRGGPSNWTLAVRKVDGEIATVERDIQSVMLRHRFFRLPIIRGIIALGESLAIGFRALAISANYAAQEEGDDEEVSTEIGRGALIFAFASAIRLPSSSSRSPRPDCELAAVRRHRPVRRHRGSDPRFDLHPLPRPHLVPAGSQSACSSTTPPSTRRSMPTRPARS